MKFKEIAEDFRVEEVINISQLEKEKEPEERNYLYYYLTKKNYAQTKAVDIVAKTFNTTHKFVHIAGTKDRAGITKQLISIAKSKRMQPSVHEEFFKRKFEDMDLEFVGEYPFRLNLGDNLGNSFEITLRQLSTDEISLARNKFSDVSTNGVLNYFDSQRFGYAQNSHLIGLDLLRGEIENAVYTILTSLPENANEDHVLFVEKLKINWDEIISGNQDIIRELTGEAPKFLKNEIAMIKHFHNAKNDFSGSLRVLPKKLRTLYIGAYQSYLFNNLLDSCDNLAKSIELCNENLSKDSLEYSYYSSLLEKDGLRIEDFSLPHMPELKPEQVYRDSRVEVSDLEMSEESEDDLNEGYSKIEVSFFLESGAYATNVIKQLFE